MRSCPTIGPKERAQLELVWETLVVDTGICDGWGAANGHQDVTQRARSCDRLVGEPHEFLLLPTTGLLAAQVGWGARRQGRYIRIGPWKGCKAPTDLRQMAAL